MPEALTDEQMAKFARDLALMVVNPDELYGSPLLTREQKDRIWGLGMRMLREQRAYARKRQRRALRLLRSYLTEDQKAELRRSRKFTVRGPSGNVYRLIPNTGAVQRVSIHGKNGYIESLYCYHDPERELPPADLTLAHLLLLANDEERFLREANEHVFEHTMRWNGEWLRRLRQARIERAQEAA